MKRFLIALFTLLFMAGWIFIAGCANPPKEIFTSTAGPFPENYEEQIKNYLGVYLQNPESLKDFSINKPPEKIKVDEHYPMIPLRKGHEVWETFIVYDAKNWNDKYTGRDLHVVWIKNNRIIAYDYKEIEIDFSIKQRMKNSFGPEKNPGENPEEPKK